MCLISGMNTRIVGIKRGKREKRCPSAQNGASSSTDLPLLIHYYQLITAALCLNCLTYVGFHHHLSALREWCSLFLPLSTPRKKKHSRAVFISCIYTRSLFVRPLQPRRKREFCTFFFLPKKLQKNQLYCIRTKLKTQ